MLLDSSGNLGLGVTPSAWSGNIARVLQVGTSANIANGFNSTYISNNAFFNGTNWTRQTANTAAMYAVQAGTANHNWSVAATGSAGSTFSYTDVMTLDASGNLTVSGGATVLGTQSGYGGGELRLGPTTSAADSAISTQATGAAGMFFDHRGTSNTGYWVWRNGTGGANTRMTLDASGNLGVGETSPGAKLEIKESSANTPRFRMYSAYNGGASDWGIDFYRDTDAANDQESAFIRANRTGGNVTGLVFGTGSSGTGATEKARITSGGNFLVNTTTSTARFCTVTTADELVMFVEKTAATNSNIATFSQTAAGGNGGQDIGIVVNIQGQNTADRIITAKFNNSGTPQDKFYVERDGDVYNATGTYGTISDERLKQDIVDAGSQWDDLKAVRFRKYRMKAEVEANPDAPAMLGVVAQELELVSPKLIEESPVWEKRDVPVLDEDGNETGETTQESVRVGETKTVKMSVLLIKAAVALQEAMARIEALEARLEALEA